MKLMCKKNLFFLFSCSLLFSVSLLGSMNPAASVGAVEVSTQTVSYTDAMPADWNQHKAIFVDSFTSAYLAYGAKNEVVYDVKCGIGSWINEGESRKDGLKRTLAEVFDDEQKEVVEGKKRIVTAMLGDEVVGFLTTETQGNGDVYLSQMAVRADRLRQGTATALIKSALARIPAVVDVFVITRNFNEATAELYKKLGFKRGEFMPAGYAAAKYDSYVLKRRPVTVTSPLSCAPSETSNLKDLQNLLQRDDSYKILVLQQKTFEQKTSPKIADKVIKETSWTPNLDPFVDVKTTNNQRIQMLDTDQSGLFYTSPDYNAGHPDAGNMRPVLYQALVRMVDTLDELAPLVGYKSGSLCIKVFEALRPLEFQAKLFADKFAEICKANPDFTQEQAEQETSRWVSPVKNNIPVHSTGLAVDIRLWDTNSETFVDMGKWGAIWGSNPNAQSHAVAELSEQQQANRLFMLMAAAKAGLVNYAYEFWHFSVDDAYARYWQNLVK